MTVYLELWFWCANSWSRYLLFILMLCQQSCYSSEDQDVIHPSNNVPSLFFSSSSSSFLFLPSFLVLFPLSGCCFSWISSLNHFDGQRISAMYMKFLRLICKAGTWDSLRSGLQEPGTCGFDCLCSHSWEFALPFCHCIAPLAEWPVSLGRPLLFLLLSPGKHPAVHQLSLEVFIDLPGGAARAERREVWD